MQGKILLIDDDPGLIDLIGGDLKERGHDVRIATSAEEGLRLLERESIDVVVTDLNMGGISGLDLCRHVRERYEDLPVIVMTAYGTLQVAVEAVRAGAYD